MPKVSQVAKCSDIFPEIEGESLSDRRVRYWRWQRKTGKKPYGAGLKSERLTLNKRQTSALVRSLVIQVEKLSQRIARLERRS